MDNMIVKLSKILCECLQASYLRPKGAPALGDNPREFCQPPGIHLQPLKWVISPCTPGPIVQVIFIKASLQATKCHVKQYFTVEPYIYIRHFQ
ncbi:hypothetical protein ATANTOWER_025403 [Ataeniobius toweri]|uniref:Uncharacterized protein n=1 Tax=Ataeniobius toweri TaxID=208326 RepID=A0ABU7B234_9TELE|nr:hypothetical protein [Ataeniobius toweri]